MLTEANVTPITEPDMAIAFAVEPEGEGVFELGVISIAGRISEIEPVSLGDFLPAEFTISGCVSNKMLHRRCPANGFFNEVWNEGTDRPLIVQRGQAGRPGATYRSRWNVRWSHAPR